MTLPVRSWLRANEVLEIVHGADGQFEDAALVRYEGYPDCVTDGDRAVLDAAMVPATDQQIIPMLAMMWERMSRPASQGDNLKMKFAGTARDLQREFPADVTMEALERILRRETWFPSWAILLAECQRLNRWRRITREALG